VDGETTIGGASPDVVDSQVVAQGSHEINFEAAAKLFLKPSFGFIVSTKVGTIVHVDAKVDGPPCGGLSDEEAGFVGAFFETNVLENGTKCLVPMPGGSSEPIEGLLETPIGTGGGEGTALRRFDDAYLIIW
jgi:hypothetical protein